MQALLTLLLFSILLAQGFALRKHAFPWFLGRCGHNSTTPGWIKLLSYSSFVGAVFSLGGVGDMTFIQNYFLLTFGPLLFLIPIFSFWGWIKGVFGSGGSSTGHLRGQALAAGEEVVKEIKRQKLPCRFDIGGVPIPVNVEDRGFLLAGSPGTGKSQAITSILETLQSEGHRAVIADASGIFYSRYAGDGAVLFNPYDKRSVQWSPLADITATEDCAAMARSIIPDGAGEAAEWAGYAQTLLEAILEHVWEADGTTGEVLSLATVATAEELRKTLPPGPVHALLDKDAAKMLGSVRAIVGSRLKPFSSLNPDAGRNAFSIRSFITNENGWLFVTYKQSQRDAMRPLIASALDIASRAVLDLPPAYGNREEQKRTWFILDELPLIGRISSLLTLLTNGSKHGAAVIAGIQTVAQLREAYGQEQAQTILATLGTWLTLRVSDAETADYMSRAIGDEEIRRVVQSGCESSKSSEFGKNWQEQYTTQRVVMPSELQNLPDLCGYLNIAGPIPACPVRLPLAEKREPVAEAFEAAPPRVRQPAPQPAPEADDQADQQPRQPEPADVPFSL